MGKDLQFLLQYWFMGTFVSTGFCDMKERKRRMWCCWSRVFAWATLYQLVVGRESDEVIGPDHVTSMR